MTETIADSNLPDSAVEPTLEDQSRQYKCWKYSEYQEYMKSLFSTVPDSIWNWFNWDEMILQQWRDGKYSIVFNDNGHPILLEELWTRYPVVKFSESEWFKKQPRDLFLIIQEGLNPIHPFIPME